MERMHPSRSNLTASRACPRCGFGGALDESGLCPRCLWTSSLFQDDSDPLLDRPGDSVGWAPQSLPMTARLLGGCELIEEIARGGMGVVYRARQVALGRMVAVKVLAGGPFASSEYARRFRGEAQTVARLRHPNIVAIHEVGEADGVAYFIMDLVEGPNLAERARRTPFLPREAATCMETMARAVAYAHAQGVLHRDLKPSNVLLDLFDQPQITDFGLAKQFNFDSQPSTLNSQLTLSGQALGSPGYAAPEQIRSGAATVQSDVYGLGATLYHLLTGRPPFVAATAIDTLHAAQHQDPVSPRALNPNVPRDLDTICLKCLEKEPSRRYPTAQALADDLHRFLHDEPILARPVTSLERAARWCRRKPALATSLVLVLVLLLVLVIGSPIAAYRINEARRQATEEAGIAAAMNEFLTEDLLRQADVWKAEAHASPNRDIRLLEVVNRASAGVDAKFGNQPLVAAKIHLTVGSVYAGLGEIEKAEHHLRTAKRLFEEQVGLDDPRTLEASHSLAVLLRVNRAEFEEAEALIRHVFNTRQRLLGAEHRDTLEAMIELAYARMDRDAYDEAEALFNTAAKQATQAFGVVDPLTLAAQEGIIYTMWDRGEHEAATQAQHELWEQRKTVQGESHPDTLHTLAELIYFIKDWEKDYSKMAGMLDHGLNLSRLAFGESGITHRLELFRSETLGQQGLFRESKELSGRLLESAATRLYGPAHPRTLASQLYVAFHKVGHEGNDADAARIFEQALATYNRVAPHAYNSQANRAWLASVYWRLGRQEEAIAIRVEYLDIQRRLYGPTSRSTLMFGAQPLAGLYARQGDWAAAAPLLAPLALSSDATLRDVANAVLLRALAGSSSQPDTLLAADLSRAIETASVNDRIQMLVALVLATPQNAGTPTLSSDTPSTSDALSQWIERLVIQMSFETATPPAEVEDRLLFGLAAISKGDWSAALDQLGPVAEGAPDPCSRVLAGLLSAMALHYQGLASEARESFDRADVTLARMAAGGDLGHDWDRFAVCLLARSQAAQVMPPSAVPEAINTSHLAKARSSWEPVQAALNHALLLARHRRWTEASAAIHAAMEMPEFSWEAAELMIPRWPLKLALIFASAEDAPAYRQSTEAQVFDPSLAAPEAKAVALFPLRLDSTFNSPFWVNANNLAFRPETDGNRRVPGWISIMNGLTLARAGDAAGALAQFESAQQSFNLHCSCAAYAYAAQTRLYHNEDLKALTDLIQAQRVLSRLKENHGEDLGALWYELRFCELAVEEAVYLAQRNHNHRAE